MMINTKVFKKLTLTLTSNAASGKKTQLQMNYRTWKISEEKIHTCSVLGT